MTGDRPYLGLLLMIGFCCLAPLGDGIAKFLGDSVPLAQILAIRFAVQAGVLVALCRAWGQPLILPARAMRLTALRTLLHIGGVGSMFLALRHLPLADALAITFVMPFLLLVSAHFFTGEEVGLRRLLACVVGFGGTLLVLQPSFAEAGAWALVPLATAVFFAGFMIVTRAVARDAGPVQLQAVSGVMATVVLFPMLVVGDARALPFLDPIEPDMGQIALLVFLGLLGTGAHLLMTQSLRYAPAATLAPVQYLEIPVATLIGWAMFGDLPGPVAAAGIAVTVGAGVYVALRERGLARAAASPAPAPPAA